MNQTFGDIILMSLLNTDIVRKKINTIFLFGITFALRYVLCAILSFIFSIFINFYISICLDIIISILLVYNTNIIYRLVEKFEDETIYLSDYFVKNYSQENFRKWKKYVYVSLSIYYMIYYFFVEINSKIMIIYIIQSLVCYLVVDNLENKNGILYDIYNKIMEILYTKQKQFIKPSLIENYIKKSNSINENLIVLDESNTTSERSNVPYVEREAPKNIVMVKENINDDFINILTNEKKIEPTIEEKKVEVKEEFINIPTKLNNYIIDENYYDK